MLDFMPGNYLNPYQDEAEQLYQFYLRNGWDNSGFRGEEIPSVGFYNPYWSALVDATSDREGWDGKPPNNSIPLRNASHGLLGQAAAYASPLGKWGHLLAVPGYNLAKFLAQNMPSYSGIPYGLDLIGDWYGGDKNSLTKASPPSWEAIMWGLRPFWGKN